MKTRAKPKLKAGSVVTAAEARRQIIEAGRRRLEAEFAARGAVWAAAAPAWQDDYRNGGKERAAEEQSRLVAERKKRRAEEIKAEAKRLKAERDHWHQYWKDHPEELERINREWEEQSRRDREERERRYQNYQANEGQSRRDDGDSARSMPWEARGPLSVLGLTTAATFAQVKARHRELALQHHPDRGGDAAEFRKIQAAYEVACRIVAGR